MTDKQIIDLTEIDKKYKDKCSLIKAGKCKNVNIFIEQSRKLKAKEQECKELKFQNKRLDEVALYWHKRIFKVERSERKLKQTLTEIKEIIEPMVKNGYFVVNEIMGDFEKILQKINEVENVENN